MATNHSASDNGASGSTRSLADRVRERVLSADRAIERRDSARRPKVGRGSKRARSTASADQPAREPLTREVRALRSVFTDLGVVHRHYRKTTGESVTPELHAAAVAFKTAPSLNLLVPVAEFLDELDLLDW